MSFLVDVNILVYGSDAESKYHRAAAYWLSQQLSGLPRSVALPWPVLIGYARVMSNPRIYNRPTPVAAVMDRIEELLSLPACWVPEAGPGHHLTLKQLATRTRAAGDLVSDAHLAALAKEHGLTVASADSDFAKFDDVKWVNPLAN